MLGKSLPVSCDGKQVIGREKPADILVPDASVSESHAEIELRGNQLAVRDLDSSNKVYDTGEPVAEALVNDGERFALG